MNPRNVPTVGVHSPVTIRWNAIFRINMNNRIPCMFVSFVIDVIELKTPWPPIRVYSIAVPVVCWNVFWKHRWRTCYKYRIVLLPLLQIIIIIYIITIIINNNIININNQVPIFNINNICSSSNIIINPMKMETEVAFYTITAMSPWGNRNKVDVGKNNGYQDYQYWLVQYLFLIKEGKERV